MLEESGKGKYLQDIRSKWERHIGQWKRSGKSQSAYCRENALNKVRFRYWKKRYAGDAPGDTGVTFVPLHIRPEISLSGQVRSISPIRIMTGGPYRIEIDKGFDPDTLAQVLRLLSGV